MAPQDLLRDMNSQLGQSQEERSPAELKVDFAQIDERSTRDFLLFLKKLAPHIRYYPTASKAPVADWRNFLDDQSVQQLLDHQSVGNTTPHLALLLAFLELYKKPQEIINRFTDRHLDFYFTRVLQLSKKAAVADRAHVLVELKKNVAPVTIGPEQLFSAGKDAAGLELVYAPVRQTVINHARIDSVRSIFLSQAGSVVRSAPIANSADGLGGQLPRDKPQWRGFGYPALPPAEVGFALASPLLRLQEGTRTIHVSLRLLHANPDILTSKNLTGAFEVYLTGPKNWLGPYQISPVLVHNLLEFQVAVPAAEMAVVDYNPAIHGYDYAARTPILKVLLKADSPHLGYRDLKDVILQAARLSVEVSGITSLILENDDGVLNPKKPFLPFGSQPRVGSRFSVGCPEAFGKNLTEASFRVQWQAAPSDLVQHYHDYGIAIQKDSLINWSLINLKLDDHHIGVPGIRNNIYFTATVSFLDIGRTQFTPARVSLFSQPDASQPQTFTFRAGPSPAAPTPSAGRQVFALHQAARPWAKAASQALVLKNQWLQPFQAAVPESLPGLITFSLDQDFLHDVYRQLSTKNMMDYALKKVAALKVLNEPYTPAIRSISFGYKAESDEVRISSATLADFANEAVQFYHLGYFGQMREHAYQRRQFSFLADTNVSLLPAYHFAGELLLGLQDLHPGDSVSILFQVAEGSADPDLPQEDLNWFVLCDNYWKSLSRSEVVLDTTNQLLTSGIITFVIPGEATTSNTILPADRIWLKAALAQNVDAVCRLIQVAANAVEVRFLAPEKNPPHLLSALPRDRIIKLKGGLPAVKALQQPFPSFSGSTAETAEAFYVRTSERLRHKNRCLSAWDYERLILENFPRVHRVKCIPHAREGCWLAPGHVLLVVIPDLKTQNRLDLSKVEGDADLLNRLHPKVDANTLRRITEFVRKNCGMQVQVKAKNPLYQEIKLDFRVRFLAGKEFNFHSRALKQALIKFLSPWAFVPDREIYFGGKIYKSVILNFVEELDYVDYVTDFKMSSFTGTGQNLPDLDEVQAATPDAILISSPHHSILPA